MSISFRGFALALVVAFVAVWLSTYTIDSLAHSAGYFAMAANAPEAVQATEQTRIIWDAQVQMTRINRAWLWGVLWASVGMIVLTTMGLALVLAAMIRGQSCEN